jgi:hypothetical protein
MHFRPWTLCFDASELEARLFPQPGEAAAPGPGDDDDDTVDGNIDPPDDDEVVEDGDDADDDADDDDADEETLWADPRTAPPSGFAAAHNDVL